MAIAHCLGAAGYLDFNGAAETGSGMFVGHVIAPSLSVVVPFESGNGSGGYLVILHPSKRAAAPEGLAHGLARTQNCNTAGACFAVAPKSSLRAS